MKESYSYQQTADKRVRCLTCAQRCFILPGQFGLCGIRKNIEGKLYALNYEKIISRSVDPIEKKPLFHFLPGSNAFSFATVGCNLSCGNCQNWQISQTVKSDKVMLGMGEEMTPQEIVDAAKKNDCRSIAYTYTEPTIFLEFALDTMRLARQRGVKNVWVSNGFMTAETLELILPYIDAINVDIKSMDDDFYARYCGGHVAPVLENCKALKRAGVWLEITTLVIPDLSDRDVMLRRVADFIASELGSDTPWHLSAFFADASWKMRDLADTPASTIRRACQLGREARLKFVYSGNVSDSPEDNTYCPHCGEPGIERSGYVVRRFDRKGKCAHCGEDLHLVLK